MKPERDLPAAVPSVRRVAQQHAEERHCRAEADVVRGLGDRLHDVGNHMFDELARIAVRRLVAKLHTSELIGVPVTGPARLRVTKWIDVSRRRLYAHGHHLVERGDAVSRADLARVLGVVVEVLWRERSGRGQYIDASLLDVQAASLANIASNYLIAGRETKRWGTAHESIVPYQVFATKDQPIAIAAAMCSINVVFGAKMSLLRAES